MGTLAESSTPLSTKPSEWLTESSQRRRMLTKPARGETRFLLKSARSARLRGIRQFAEQEVVIPSGTFKDHKFAVHRQPFTGLLYGEFESRRWRRFAVTGPSQSGKSLGSYVTPIMYHLFEVRETVIAGIPSMEMARDKWDRDILPAIEASRYREFLPTKGAGSRGGSFESITLKNGATLRFMSGGGGDKHRAGFTGRVCVFTEVDGMDEAGESSREADPISQIEARTLSYGSRAVIYLECTVSTEKGRTWQEYTKGSQSRIVVQCKSCGQWVTPEREHMVGWQDADDKLTAMESARFMCPGENCGVLWGEGERRELNANARLLHRGQEITEEGEIVGAMPRTDTLGFRWNAFNNLFLKTSELAGEAWVDARSANPDAAERRQRQFFWAIPVEPEVYETVPLEQDTITRRKGSTGRGIVPSGTTLITVGCDIGKYVGHRLAIAWLPGAIGTIIDYAAFDISSRDLTPPVAILAALRNMRDEFEKGWDGRTPDAVWVDSGYESDAVYAFTREAGSRYRPTKGHGVAQERSTPYAAPRKLAKETPKIGDGWHVAYQAAEKIWLIHLNSDHWKSRAHQYLISPVGQPGSLVLYDAPPQEHLTLARHLTAERKVEEFIPGKGTVERWVRDRKQNHFLDCLMQACAAADHLGVKPLPGSVTPSTSQRSQSEGTASPMIRMPDGRPFLITER